MQTNKSSASIQRNVAQDVIGDGWITAAEPQICKTGEAGMGYVAITANKKSYDRTECTEKVLEIVSAGNLP